MRNEECVAFLQAVCPALHLRWPGFRKVRRQVCKRVDRRLKTLGLANPAAYADYLAAHPEEWRTLDSLCRISISRFFRDRAVFDRLAEDILPGLVAAARRRGGGVRCWSAGCASGEEPYSLSILWRLGVAPHHPGQTLEIIATDADETLLGRAARGCYPPGCLREIPAEWRAAAFEPVGEERCLRPAFRADVTFERQDIRQCMPAGPFDMVLCRYLAFTYFDASLQERMLSGIAARLRPGGYLIIGAHETLPEAAPGFAAAGKPRSIYRRAGDDG